MPSEPTHATKELSPRQLHPAVATFQQFMLTSISSSKLLLLATIVALIWANSPWAAQYFGLWNTELGISIGSFELQEDLAHWVNDGLMVIFFLVVGLEIKREVLIGELRSPRRAALPIAGALGGMIVPAIIYTLFNMGHPGAHGWGIPMATDIAFALAILAVVGNRIPNGLRVFLTALAIVDDLGAVVVIAIFYTSDLNLTSFFWAMAMFVLLIIVNRLGIYFLPVYAVLGIAMWLFMLDSGVHATIAGVLLAMTIPATARVDVPGYLAAVPARLREIAQGIDGVRDDIADIDQQAAIDEIDRLTEGLQSPLEKVANRFAAPVSFVIIPIFALANAGVAFFGDSPPHFDRVAFGVFLGLFLGKQIGITLASFVAVKARLAAMPDGGSWNLLWGVAILGGIGFTMSLFVAELAFDDASLLASAKVGIFAGSILSAIVGFAILNAMASRSKSR